MRGVITVPKKVITGAFTILFSFLRETDFTVDDFRVETVSGDPLGHHKDSFGGRDKNYHALCYLPEGTAGVSRISVVKDGVRVKPVVVEYDTVRTVTVAWAEPRQIKNNKIEIPLALDASVVNLRKSHFTLSRPLKFYLYGSGMEWTLVTAPTQLKKFRVSVSGSVVKHNGLVAAISGSDLAVDI